jgi:hypothetical protein
MDRLGGDVAPADGSGMTPASAPAPAGSAPRGVRRHKGAYGESVAAIMTIHEQREVTVSRIFWVALVLHARRLSSPSIIRRMNGTTRAFYTATICRDDGKWKWATAEPATERWGALQ